VPREELSSEDNMEMSQEGGEGRGPEDSVMVG